MTRYRIVPEHSYVSIEGRSNVHPIRSASDGLEGYIDISFSPQGHVDMTAPVAASLSLPVHHLSSGNPLEDRELQRRIDARRYPTIDSALTDIVQSDERNNYRVGGDVTFHGVTRRHDDLMHISSVDEETIQLIGRSSFDIREYGMEPPRILMVKVEPEVEIRVQISAIREREETASCA